MTTVLASLTVIAAIAQAPRWLRIAQREHYLASVGRFAVRWWESSWANRVLFVVAFVLAFQTEGMPWALVGISVIVVAAPLGLGLRGRSSALAWTARLKATAITTSILTLVGIVVGALLDAPLVYAAILLGFPWIVDSALAIWNPIQRGRDQRWVDQARAGLDRSGARVVAITGSYGKTTTKGYLAHLLSGVTSVTASPASFNNRMGLARSVNEHLGVGTDVFIAEMGTYGAGEIRDLCLWIPPEVAVLTALGPVHLERMKSLEAIAEAKREIFEHSDVGVMTIDDPLLAVIAEEEASRRRTITVSTAGRTADVTGDPKTGVISVGGEEIGSADPSTIQISNAACAVGAVLALGFDVHAVAERLSTLPIPPHRQVVARSERGFFVIDDTFNSNPAGAERAVELLSETGTGRRVVVTPGMVELGSRQKSANREFARRSALVSDDLVIVGRTNRGALEAGAEEAGHASVHFFETRDEAVDWVRGELGPDDAVLYENDLPDHYP